MSIDFHIKFSGHGRTHRRGNIWTKNIKRWDNASKFSRNEYSRQRCLGWKIDPEVDASLPAWRKEEKKEAHVMRRESIQRRRVMGKDNQKGNGVKSRGPLGAG